MAKISPVSIKYMVHATFKSEGPLEKPDVIGALFGQTEGLLGSDLEMRELQKEGKIGRIEVELETVEGKTIGEIRLPSALDKSETTIIAAALETIDRIGPTEAEIKVTKIEDVRGVKRDYIIERAKRLLEGLDGNGSFEEMTKTVKEEARTAKIQEYGDERLPAGDLSGEEVIVVEGRADVVNLLKNRVNNVIGMNGTKLPAEISKLGNEKILTLFIDGDRGGQLIAKNVISNAKIAYVAVAPSGMEVEELTGKEILIALRKRVSVEDYTSKRYGPYTEESEPEPVKEEVESMPILEADAKKKIKDVYEKIRGTKSALLLDFNLDIIRRVGSREVVKNIEMSRTKVSSVIIDGIATGAIIRVCDENKIAYLAATTFGSSEYAKVKLISL